ncbi:MAG: hypothetical protein H0W61_03370 [Bacteroidetes bacterium]|nr:hypothetical protein [Bacteroidota bacterium]
MKMRLAKIIPYTGVVISVIYMSSCNSTYDSNNIPANSTSNKKSEELYNGTTDARKESVGFVKKDTTQGNQQMEPANSTGASQTGVSEKK